MVAQIAWPNKGLPNKYLTTYPRALSLPMGWNRNKRWGVPLRLTIGGRACEMGMSA